MSREEASPCLLPEVKEGFATPPAPRYARAMTDPADDAELDAAALIELYFELDEPDARDAVLDKLAAIDAPLVTDFFRSMLSADEDEVARALAAQHLAARGDESAIAYMEEVLREPEDVALFTHALQTLAAVRGQAFYETLAGLWRDAERDNEERHAAMVEMESLDAPRALADFVLWIDAASDFTTLVDADLELVIMAFVRHAHVPGREALERMRARAAAAAELDADDREEIVGMIDEGLALLTE